MCKNNDTARQIAATARTLLSSVIADDVKMLGILGTDCPTQRQEWIQCSTLNFVTHCIAFMQVGLLPKDEMMAWTAELRKARARGTVETTTCDDCGATIPTDLATVLGDGDLCLCAGCKARTCGPLTTADAERGSDGFGDFEDAPAFMRGHPTELD